MIINIMNEYNDWIKCINEYKYIYVFGATNSALSTNSYIHNWSDKEIEGYIVSSKKNNPDIFNGKNVYSLDEIRDEMKKECLVIVSQSWDKYKGIKQILRNSGFVHIIPTANQIKMDLSSEDEKYINYMFYLDKAKRDIFKKHLNIKGEILCRIYAVTSHLNLHKVVKKYNSKYIEYIQAGAALTEVRMSYVCDNVGDNISVENPFFCELTAGYWISKNDKTNMYVGLYHYSRGLNIDDEELCCLMQEGIDVILPKPYVVRYPIITRIHKDDVECLYRAVKEVSPKYIKSMERYFSNRCFCAGNIMIAYKDIYIEYYNWLMKVLRKCEEILKKVKLIPAKRLWGYYGEHLLNIYFLHHAEKINVKFAPMINMLIDD